ncbi:3-phenylpropionate/cinnamic acid dioxygenase subunit beta [Sphingobium sp. TomTYG45]
MTVPPGREISSERLAYLDLCREIEDFLYREADLIDARVYQEWLDLFAEDVRYWMPMRKNMAFRDRDRDITSSDDIGWFDDDKLTLTKRIKQILTGVHWAEEPLSRVSHHLSTVRLDPPVNWVAEGETVTVRSHLLIYRNRLETETNIISGRRTDVLRRVGKSFQIVERKFVPDQSVLLSKDFTFFF